VFEGATLASSGYAKSLAESPVHANYKNAIVDSRETSTLVLNKKSTPCIRARSGVSRRRRHSPMPRSARQNGQR
jgi:hypothetical protein